jgi:hypothetical protein
VADKRRWGPLRFFAFLPGMSCTAKPEVTALQPTPGHGSINLRSKLSDAFGKVIQNDDFIRGQGAIEDRQIVEVTDVADADHNRRL